MAQMVLICTGCGERLVLAQHDGPTPWAPRADDAALADWLDEHSWCDGDRDVDGVTTMRLACSP